MVTVYQEFQERVRHYFTHKKVPVGLIFKMEFWMEMEQKKSDKNYPFVIFIKFSRKYL